MSPTPSPSPVSVHSVRGLVFYDENGSGLLDREEEVRLPDVRVVIGGASGASASEGAFTVTGVPAIRAGGPAGPAHPRQSSQRLPNNVIRRMVPEEGGVLADPHALFLAEGGELAELFTDHVHPNDRGYSLIAEAFFRAIAGGEGG